jgi:hypothetical protein
MKLRIITVQVEFLRTVHNTNVDLRRLSVPPKDIPLFLRLSFWLVARLRAPRACMLDPATVRLRLSFSRHSLDTSQSRGKGMQKNAFKLLIKAL